MADENDNPPVSGKESSIPLYSFVSPQNRFDRKRSSLAVVSAANPWKLSYIRFVYVSLSYNSNVCSLTNLRVEV